MQALRFNQAGAAELQHLIQWPALSKQPDAKVQHAPVLQKSIGEKY